MKGARRSRKWLLIGVLLGAAAIAAGMVAIDGRRLPYSQLTNVRGSSVNDLVANRQATLFEAAGAYRTIHGPSTLGAGSTFRMTYSDGSSEAALIPSLGGTPIPVTGSQCNKGSDCGTDFQPE